MQCASEVYFRILDAAAADESLSSSLPSFVPSILLVFLLHRLYGRESIAREGGEGGGPVAVVSLWIEFLLKLKVI